MFNWHYRIMLALAIAFAGAGAWKAYRSSASVNPSSEIGVGPIQVDCAMKDLGPVPIGTSSVEFTLTNTSGSPCKILGAPRSCHIGCCFSSAAYAEGKLIPPGCSFVIRYEGRVTTGPFEAPLILYVESGGGLKTIELGVKGVGINPNEVLGHDPATAAPTGAKP